MFSSTIRYIFLLITLSFGLIACTGQTTDSVVPGFPVTDSTDSSSINTRVVTLKWLPATSNSDGSSLIDLSGYKVYFGTSADNLDSTIAIDNPSLSTYVIENLEANTTYFFSITSVNSNGLESILSDIVSVSI